MKIDFVKLSPTQNMTILVKNFYEKDKFIEVANKLLDYSNVYAEQVGYITKPNSDKAVTRLDMMGGEFCGNASMSIASLYARDNKLEKDVEHCIPLEVSGAVDIVNCYVTPKDDYFIGKVKIPAPTEVLDIEITIDNTKLMCKLVHLEGISHIFINDDGSLDKKAVSNYIIKNNKEYTNQDALGVLFYNKKNNSMYPIVYVVSTNSIIHERGCGSGSAATGTVLTMGDKETKTIKVKQPGGTIYVTVTYEDKVLKDILIEGNVYIVAEGIAYI